MKAVHMEQKYQEADNIITFNHNLKFSMGARDVRAKAAFSTCFESTSLDWELHLHKQFMGRSLAIRESNWVINLNGTGGRDLYPPIFRLSLTLNVLDSDGPALTYFIPGESVSQMPRLRRNDHKTYMTEPSSDFARSLNNLMADPKKREKTMQIETRIEFRKSDIEGWKFLVADGAPVVGAQLDYFFHAITDRSRHDIQLKTANGNQSFWTNKEILCLASSFFRQHLKESSTEYVTRAEMLESIDICVTFMVTGRYKKPVRLGARLAKEIYELALQWKAFEPKILKNSIEQHCCEELRQNHDDFLYVCNLLVMADDAQFINVQNCCIATISFYHFHDFVRTFIAGNHPLKERFSQRREFLKPSLSMQIKRGFVSSRETKSFVKYLPTVGQD